ncbi:MAG: C25 family cysteine peptidase [candidate division WOR-3 bacterium]|nr:C25 family cysteine peptidase [candidate division WOR-3 bacterium]MCX7757189.1 C25 family cysteine peptidase [candidate division WOR-3 bacterium]MDW7987926.1 C25 family cysteine peptidase [candidate division WOR-3 bacterium]
MKNHETVLVFALFLYAITNIYALTGAKYLIITPENYVSAVQPLANWKTKKGVKTQIVTTSQIGSSSTQIKNFIVNAYNTWDIRPEYILLVGTSSSIPSSGISDDYYADVSGNYLIELSIGRIPCTSVSQCSNIINKIIAYERNPYMLDSSWFIKGTVIIREDGSTPPDNVYWENARYIAGLWRSYGYAQIDTFSRLMGHSATNVINAINEGRMFVVYRGEAVSNWWSPFAMSPDNLSNGYKTPIVVSGTCQTMSLSDNSYLGNTFMITGSALSPKGAVAFLGTTRVASGSNLALNRGTVTKGIFQAIFGERIWRIGDALKRGKFLVDSIRPPNFTTERYSEWELFGDPEMEVWTYIPQRLTVQHDTIIPLGSQNFTVTVSDHQLPLTGAKVCIMMDTLIYETALTDHTGTATFNITPNAQGILYVTVTAHNYLPYEKEVTVAATGIHKEANSENKVNKSSLLFNLEPNISSGEPVKISFSLFQPSSVSFNVYNHSGALVKTLISNQTLLPGIYNANWNLLDNAEQKVPKGIYFCKLTTETKSLTKKIIVVR